MPSAIHTRRTRRRRELRRRPESESGPRRAGEEGQSGIGDTEVNFQKVSFFSLLV